MAANPNIALPPGIRQVIFRFPISHPLAGAGTGLWVFRDENSRLNAVNLFSSHLPVARVDAESIFEAYQMSVRNFGMLMSLPLLDHINVSIEWLSFEDDQEPAPPAPAPATVAAPVAPVPTAPPQALIAQQPTQAPAPSQTASAVAANFLHNEAQLRASGQAVARPIQHTLPATGNPLLDAQRIRLVQLIRRFIPANPANRPWPAGRVNRSAIGNEVNQNRGLYPGDFQSSNTGVFLESTCIKGLSALVLGIPVVQLDFLSKKGGRLTFAEIR